MNKGVSRWSRISYGLLCAWSKEFLLCGAATVIVFLAFDYVFGYILDMPPKPIIIIPGAHRVFNEAMLGIAVAFITSWLFFLFKKFSISPQK